MAERTLLLQETIDLRALFGDYDENVKKLEREYGVRVVLRGNEMKIVGEEAAIARCDKAVAALCAVLRSGEVLDEQKVYYVFDMIRDSTDHRVEELTRDTVLITSKGRPLKAKTLGQKRYLDAIRDNSVVFGIGPAGTGKTYLAVAMAVKAFKEQRVSRIVLTRPAVEAGEKLGFLPGDLQHKVDPYLRPLYDALFDMMGAENYQKQTERGCIEVAPLAYMRGRTLDDSFVILDEAQNTTREQMKMFLTRLGVNSRAVVTGDITQVDLPEKSKSGLLQAVHILRGIDDIAFVHLTQRDVVRHRLVQSIIKAYEKYADEGRKPRR